jgi:hypothetical protein
LSDFSPRYPMVRRIGTFPHFHLRTGGCTDGYDC